MNHPDSSAPRSRFTTGLLAGVMSGLVVLGVIWLIVPRPPQQVVAPSPSPSVTTPTASVTPTPTPTPTPSATPTPTATPSEPVAGVVTSLPKGSWIAVLGSMRKQNAPGEAAVSRAAQLSASGGHTVVAIDTDAIPGLTPGYYALAVTGLADRDAVRALCPSFGRPYGDTCYARQIGG